MTEPTVKCFKCKKRPTNCTCFEYRIERLDATHAAVFVDNVATELVRGQDVLTWQPRRNAKVWVRPTFIDGFGPILRINGGEEHHRINLETVKILIEEGNFFYENFRGLDGFRVPEYENTMARRFAFLRPPRKSRGSKAA